MIGWQQIEDNLFDWATAATGLVADGQISFAFNNIGRSCTPSVVIDVQSVQSVGIDDISYVDSGLDLVECLVGQRIISFDVQSFYVKDKSNSGLDLARDAIDKMRCSWELASTTALFDAAKIGQLSTGQARNLTAIDNGLFESRWAMTYEVNALCVVTDSGNIITTIDEIKGESHILDKPIRSFKCPK